MSLLLLLQSAGGPTPITGADTAAVTEAATVTAILTATDTATVVDTQIPGVTAHTTETPTSPDLDNGNPITVGARLTVDNPGTIAHLWFYVPGTNTGTYTLGLYTTDTDDDPTGTGTGTLLASASVAASAVRAGTWAAVPITPQSVTPGVVYTVARHATSGRYVATTGAFTAGPISNGDVTLIQSGTNPTPPGLGTLRNGVFNEGASLAYPADNFGQPDYHVDVAFIATAITPVSDGDTATLTEAQTAGAGTSGTDATTIVDTATLTTATITADTTTLAESATVDVTTTDTLVVADTATLVVATGSADTATVTDDATTGTPLTATDAASVADTAGVGAATATTDAGALTDQATVTATTTAAETAGITDAGAITAAIATTESAAVADTANVTVVITAVDTAGIADTVFLATLVAAADVAAFDELAQLGDRTVTADDTLTVVDSGSGPPVQMRAGRLATNTATRHRLVTSTRF